FFFFFFFFIFFFFFFFYFFVFFFFFFFFFQAEDGIRDFHVTGVQTCALPISSDRASARPLRIERRVSGGRDHGGNRRHRSGRRGERSEERRVGKECRSRW